MRGCEFYCILQYTFYYILLVATSSAKSVVTRPVPQAAASTVRPCSVVLGNARYSHIPFCCRFRSERSVFESSSELASVCCCCFGLCFRLYLNKSSLVIVLCLVLYTCYFVSIAMEWTDEKVLVLIEEYKSRPGLWEPNHPHYKYVNRKNDYWRSLANAVQTNVAEVKRKVNSLLASFRRERAKVKKTSGKSSKQVFESNWFAYSSMVFLLDKFKLQPTPRSSEV